MSADSRKDVLLAVETQWAEQIDQRFEGFVFHCELISESGREAERMKSEALRDRIRSELDASAPKPGLIRASISHFRDSAGHWIVGVGCSNPEIQSVGIDAEWCNRSLGPRLRFRISNDHERNLGLSTLEIWVAKEAAFKANPRNSGTLITEYGIESFDRDTHRGRVSRKGWSCEVTLFQFRDWKLALAVF